jgi:hypothetical protein
VGEREFVGRRVAGLAVLERREQLGVAPHGAEHGAQAPHVLGVPPAGVVPPAVGVRDEGDARAHGAGHPLA